MANGINKNKHHPPSYFSYRKRNPLISLNVPQELRSFLENKAKEENLTLSTYVRRELSKTANEIEQRIIEAENRGYARGIAENEARIKREGYIEGKKDGERNQLLTDTEVLDKKIEELENTHAEEMKLQEESFKRQIAELETKHAAEIIQARNDEHQVALEEGKKLGYEESKEKAMAEALAEMEKKDLFKEGYKTAHDEIMAEIEMMIQQIENDPIRKAYKQVKLNIEKQLSEEIAAFHESTKEYSQR